MRQIQEIASDRHEPKKDIDESRVGGWVHNSEKRHYCGVLGEWAFAKYYDLKIDSKVYPRSDQGVDFRVQIESEEFDSELVDVDVKSSLANDPELMVEVGEVDADYYVLCRFPDSIPQDESECIVELVGGATREMLLNREPRESLKYGHENYHFQSKYLLDLFETEAVEPIK